MTRRLAFARFLLASACVWPTLAASQSAIGRVAQTASTGGEETQGRLPPPGSGSPSYPAGKEIRVVAREPYAEAIGLIAQDERRYQKELREGKQPGPKRTNYAELFVLSDAEDDAMRAILLDASDRILALQKEISAEGEELKRHYDDELADKRFALIAQLQPIYDAVPGRLKEEMGEKAFKKADEFFNAGWGKMQTETLVYYYRRE
jgi:hypothetical protein